jgi:hypothetical protein
MARTSGRRRNHDARVITLGKAIHAAIDAYNARHPMAPFAITDAVSRIVANDPDYVPPRKRIAGRKRSPVKNPGVFTVQSIAAELDTAVGALLGEEGYEITDSDRRTFRWFASFLDMRFPVARLAAVSLPDEQSFRVKDFRARSRSSRRRLHVRARSRRGVRGAKARRDDRPVADEAPGPYTSRARSDP